MSKRLYIIIVRALLRLPLPKRLRTTLLWPLTSRVLGVDFNETMTLASGITMHSYLGDHLGREMLFYGHRQRYFWEPETCRLIAQLVKDARLAIVAGAHIGLLALETRAAMQNQDSQTVTFEPIRDLYETTRGNIALNSATLPNITVEHSAIGDTNGTISMISDRIRSSVTTDVQHANATTVPITTLDTYLTSKCLGIPDFILLDIEGHELPALRGLQKTLSHNPPRDIIYEIAHPVQTLANAEEIWEFLASFGYEQFVIHDYYDAAEIPVHNPNIVSVTAIRDADFTLFTTLRYFNVWATRRSPEEISLIVNLQPAILR